MCDFFWRGAHSLGRFKGKPKGAINVLGASSLDVELNKWWVLLLVSP